MTFPAIVEEMLEVGRQRGAVELDRWMKEQAAEIRDRYAAPLAEAWRLQSGQLPIDAIELAIVDAFAAEVLVPALLVQTIWTGQEFFSGQEPVETVEPIIRQELAALVAAQVEALWGWGMFLGLSVGAREIGPNRHRLAMRLGVFEREALPVIVGRVRGERRVVDLGRFVVSPAALDRLRLDAGWSQEDMAAATEVGISTLNRHLRGKKTISRSSAHKYATALSQRLGVPIETVYQAFMGDPIRDLKP